MISFITCIASFKQEGHLPLKHAWWRVKAGCSLKWYLGCSPMGVMEDEDFRQYTPQQSFHERAGGWKIVFLAFATPFHNMFWHLAACFWAIWFRAMWVVDVGLDPLSLAILCLSPRRGLMRLFIKCWRTRQFGSGRWVLHGQLISGEHEVIVMWWCPWNGGFL